MGSARSRLARVGGRGTAGSGAPWTNGRMGAGRAMDGPPAGRQGRSMLIEAAGGRVTGTMRPARR